MTDYLVPQMGVFSWQKPVLSMALTDPPGGESKGDRYIPKSVAGGAWATFENYIAQYNGATYDFTTPTEGMTIYDKNTNNIFFYNGGWNSISTLSPAASAVPIGTIVAWQGGYFTNTANAGFTMVVAAANTIAAVNTVLNASGWYVCDGAAVNNGSSTIWNAAARYLPNISDNRFIQGDNTAGTIGGANSASHTHTIGSYVASSESSHTHSIGTTSTSSGNQSVTHTHTGPSHIHTQVTAGMGFTGTGGTGATGNASVTHTHTYDKANAASGGGSSHTHTLSGTSASTSLNYRPLFLSAFYLVRVF
jgi:hypothetical protein